MKENNEIVQSPVLRRNENVNIFRDLFIFANFLHRWSRDSRKKKTEINKTNTTLQTGRGNKRITKSFTHRKSFKYLNGMFLKAKTQRVLRSLANKTFNKSFQRIEFFLASKKISPTRRVLLQRCIIISDIPTGSWTKQIFSLANILPNCCARSLQRKLHKFYSLRWRPNVHT